MGYATDMKEKKKVQIAYKNQSKDKTCGTALTTWDDLQISQKDFLNTWLQADTLALRLM